MLILFSIEKNYQCTQAYSVRTCNPSWTTQELKRVCGHEILFTAVSMHQQYSELSPLVSDRMRIRMHKVRH